MDVGVVTDECEEAEGEVVPGLVGEQQRAGLPPGARGHRGRARPPSCDRMPTCGAAPLHCRASRRTSGRLRFGRCASPRRSTTPSVPMLELAAAPDGPVKGERLATAQAIPHKFLENILARAAASRARREPAGRRGRLRARPPGGRDQRRRRDPGGRGADRDRARDAARGASCTSGARRPLRAPGSTCARRCAGCSRSTTLADLVAGELPDEAVAISRGPSPRAPRRRSSGSAATQTICPSLELELVEPRSRVSWHEHAARLGGHELDPGVEAVDA